MLLQSSNMVLEIHRNLDVTFLKGSKKIKLKNKLYTPSVYICGLLTLVKCLITYTVIVSIYFIFFLCK